MGEGLSPHGPSGSFCLVGERAAGFIQWPRGEMVTPIQGMSSPQTSPNSQLSGGPQLRGIISPLESPILTRPGANV